MNTNTDTLQFATDAAAREYRRFGRMDRANDTVNGAIIHGAGQTWNHAPIRTHRAN
jgi:hypothetical protein